MTFDLFAGAVVEVDGVLYFGWKANRGLYPHVRLGAGVVYGVDITGVLHDHDKMPAYRVQGDETILSRGAFRNQIDGLGLHTVPFQVDQR